MHKRLFSPQGIKILRKKVKGDQEKRRRLEFLIASIWKKDKRQKIKG